MAVGTAAAIVGGSIVSAVLGSRATKKSAEAQAAGIDTATEEERRQFDITTQQLTDAEQVNRADINKGLAGSIQEKKLGLRGQFRQLDPFASAGREALGQQQALLGLGDEGQQEQAFAAFRESPGQRFMRDRAEKNLLRNQAAIGGIGGGNVRSALVQQGAGFAAQDFGNQFNRLGQISAAGQNAATNIGQARLSTRTNIGQDKFNAGQLLGSGAINTAARQGQFGQNFAQNVGNLAVQGGQARATGIQGQNQALQQGFGGLLTGLSAGGGIGGQVPSAGGSAITPGSFSQGSGLSQFTF